MTVVAELKKGGKGAKGKLHVTIEPKGESSLNGTGQPELEIEGKPGSGVTFKTPVLKDKAGVAKKPKEFVVEFQLDETAKPGEVGVPVEIRVVVVKGKESKSRVVKLTTPVVIP